ncbi:HigA family addiction module antitoxin [Dyella japonica]|jgi:addiction module HigA family antidote|uniref:HTH cro/C1-type domain-containing protein n=1 Tax=Dyella japonica DSM 16301 TaxID=1440762 RepID=A0A0G9H238_9GAMM|nr:HigA family addiction module antitoxin [Dyella japonica]KLD63910.1 hypothetical protein Y882_09845 [Dyella japonica DSM 16301]
MTTKKKLPPIHPGEILRGEFMEPLELSANALARELGVTPTRVNEIANCKRNITADTALRLGRYFGTSAAFWMNLQQQFDIETAEDQLGDALAHIHPRAA